MKNKKLDGLYDKIEQLERNRIAYLEADKNADARRIKKQIEKVELEIRLFNLEKTEKELAVYKKVVSNYPELLYKIKKELSTLK